MLADLTKAGWTVKPWVRASDGSAQIELSKPFSSPSEVSGIVEELSGTDGPLRDVTVSRDQGAFSTTYSAKGTIDLANLETGLTTDPGVVAALSNQQVDVNAIDQSLLERDPRLVRAEGQRRAAGSYDDRAGRERQGDRD